MRKYIPALALFGLLGCDLSTAPEIRNSQGDLAMIAQWNANIAGVGTSPLTGTLNVRSYGSYMESAISISNAPAGAEYQWRIFRGTCDVNVATGLTLFGSHQAHPNLVASGSGTASLNRTLAASLHTGFAYSVRLRPTTTTINWNGTNPIACGNLQLQ
jgi:hypothetical protein